MRYDAAIVGGGPAGLSAALVLARCRRSVVVIDAGKPRNYAARHLHNFLSREGVNPARLLAMGRREVARALSSSSLSSTPRASSPKKEKIGPRASRSTSSSSPPISIRQTSASPPIASTSSSVLSCTIILLITVPLFYLSDTVTHNSPRFCTSLSLRARL